MFSSKSSRGKWAWAFVDLLVVIIGVYIAFLIQSSAAERKDKQEQAKVLTALKYELEAFRIQFPGFAQYMENYYDRIKDDPETDFSGWRYVEPQYAYQIIEYGLSVDNESIVDFQLYDALQKLHVRIKQLEHIERLITEIAGNYKQPIPELAGNHELNLERKADNSSQFRRFLMFARSRASNLLSSADAAKQALDLINERLGPEKRKEIESEFILSRSSYYETEEKFRGAIKNYFPDFSDEEIDKLYQESQRQD
ncbi:MAG: hypothetical protein Tsb0034_04290 [Ekhidna sp.]